MLTLNGYDIEIEEPDSYIFEYMDSFFDFESLLYYTDLSFQGFQKYSSNSKENVINAILMTTVHNPDYRKYERFELNCEEWDLYFNEHFLGFERIDVNKSIAKIVARDIEKGKDNGRF